MLYFVYNLFIFEVREKMKYALVTGATSGLGYEVAKALTQNGWFVFACGRNEDALKEYSNEDEYPVKMDITDQSSIDAAYALVCSKTDHLDAIINFSGVQQMASLIEGDVRVIEDVLKVNLMGMVRVNKTFFPLIKKCKGRIINCSSECGWMTPQPFNGPYTLSKYAVEAYNDSLRRELMFLDIPVIKIQPGSFKTAMHSKTAKSFDKLIENTHYYKDILETMKFFMDFELKFANDPKHLVNAVIKAVSAPHPKQKYRVKNSKLLEAVEALHPVTVDSMYKRMMKSKSAGALIRKITQ